MIDNDGIYFQAVAKTPDHVHEISNFQNVAGRLQDIERCHVDCWILTVDHDYGMDGPLKPCIDQGTSMLIMGFTSFHYQYVDNKI